MRIAFTVLDENGSELDDRFGRAEYFAIYDTDTKDIEIIENIAKNESGGAGGKAVRTLFQNKVQAVISGEFGPKAAIALKDFEIKAYRKGGAKTLSEALHKFGEGSLEEIEESTVDSHNGLRKV